MLLKLLECAPNMILLLLNLPAICLGWVQRRVERGTVRKVYAARTCTAAVATHNNIYIYIIYMPTYIDYVHIYVMMQQWVSFLARVFPVAFLVFFFCVKSNEATRKCDSAFVHKYYIISCKYLRTAA